MSRKKIIYIVSGIVVGTFLLYHSVYFMSLTERTEQLKAQTFDPRKAIEIFWEEASEKLPEQAVELSVFDELLSSNPQDLAEKYGKTLGIGAPYSILVKGKVDISEINDELLRFHLNSKIDYAIRIGFIFSNTVREASGYFDLDKFETTMDFNLVALEINQHIVHDVVAPVVSRLTPGVTIEFLGAADIHLRKLPTGYVEIIPIQIKTIQP